MTQRVEMHGIGIEPELYDFVNQEALPGSGVAAGQFWNGLAALLRELGPRNAALLQRRDVLQRDIDVWHRAHPGAGFDPAAYRQHLRELGYLVADGADFAVTTRDVDAEIATLAGPQLVVPVDNARYALNAANARWGSLYDALYGTDAIAYAGGAPKSGGYDAGRGAQVVAYVRAFLDTHFPLANGSHRDARHYALDERGLLVRLDGGAMTALREPAALAGYQGERAAPSVVLLVHHGLHVELRIDRQHAIGAGDPAGISDVVLESALTTIQDCEDSVAAVDAADKVRVYRNWLGLMQGTLQANFDKGGRTLVRRLNEDRRYRQPAGGELVLPGRSLMLVRNVGHHMMSDMITLDGRAVPETFIDAAVTALAALHDLRGSGARRNSRAGSIYVVKPKMHGPEEVGFATELFARVEGILGLDPCTMKIGIMDEERRTTVNLRECIRAARDRVVFINTGFLDRTGDEIHTSMEAGAVLRKNDLKKARWLDAYERQNVELGLACGLRGHAQIGKGMWAMPDLMADMLKAKIAHPAGRRQHGMGAVADRRDATCTALPPGRCGSRAVRNRTASTRVARGHSHAAADGDARMGRDADRGGAQQQCAEHPRLRRALDRRGRGLFEGAGFLQRRADGGSRDAAHLEPACRELAASRSVYAGPGHTGARAHGAGRRPPECRRSGLPEVERIDREQYRVPGRARPDLPGNPSAQRLYRGNPACAPARAESSGQ